MALVTTSAFAQTEHLELLQSKFWSGGFDVYSNGWKANFKHGNVFHSTSRHYYEIEIASVHHSKEYRQTQDFGWTVPGIPPPKPFVFGKQNSFMNFNLSYGIYKQLGEKAQKSGVSIGFNSSVGLSLGITKPYYLWLLFPLDDTTSVLRMVKYSEENKNIFLDNFSIYGGGGFKEGITELKFIPGAHLKAALDFDWASYNEYIKSIEIGVSLDAYYKKIPIMILENNIQFFPALYCGFVLEKNGRQLGNVRNNYSE